MYSHLSENCAAVQSGCKDLSTLWKSWRWNCTKSLSSVK